MSYGMSLASPPFGLQFPKHQCIVTNRSSADTVVGQVYQFAILNTLDTDGDVDNNRDGSETSGLANIVATDSTQSDWNGILCVAEEAVADNARLLVTVVGRTNALVNGATDVAQGDALEVEDAGGTLITASADNCMICAIALEAQTDPDTLSDVYFNGFAGIGSNIFQET